jgi:hypothetical protein
MLKPQPAIHRIATSIWPPPLKTALALTAQATLAPLHIIAAPSIARSTGAIWRTVAGLVNAAEPKIDQPDLPIGHPQTIGNGIISPLPQKEKILALCYREDASKQAGRDFHPDRPRCFPDDLLNLPPALTKKASFAFAKVMLICTS